MNPPDPLDDVEAEVVGCRRCPRLVEWRERVAREKRAAFEDWRYWGRPVPGFGDPDAWLLIVGLAPAAHGANRTGRMFTGDRSGDWLYRALHKAGLANQAASRERGDGLRLSGAYVTATVRCAPPENRPRPSERRSCRPYLEREIDALLSGLDVIVPLGGYAYRHVMRIFRDRKWKVPSPMPDFGHGLEVGLERDGEGAGESGSPTGYGSAEPGSATEAGAGRTGVDRPSSVRPRALTLVCSYHPSQQNTFTGTLTEEMFDAVWRRVLDLRSG